MNRSETAAVYAFVTSLFDREIRSEVAEAWHALLGELPAHEVLDATNRLCQRGLGRPPRPDEIFAEAKRGMGDGAPDVEAAVGHFLAGNWDVHPAVATAARQVHWDRRALPDKAERQFRSLYAGVVDHPRPVGPQLGTGSHPVPLVELLRGEDDER